MISKISTVISEFDELLTPIILPEGTFRVTQYVKLKFPNMLLEVSYIPSGTTIRLTGVGIGFTDATHKFRTYMQPCDITIPRVSDILDIEIDATDIRALLQSYCNYFATSLYDLNCEDDDVGKCSTEPWEDTLWEAPINKCPDGYCRSNSACETVRS